MQITPLNLFLMLLGLIFIILKLTSVIAWSWTLVMLPIYGWMGLIVIGLVFLAIGKLLEEKDY